MPLVDAHTHAWVIDPARYPWRPLVPTLQPPARPAPVAELLADLAAAGVRQAVLTQPAIYGDDNAYLAEAVAQHPTKLAGVGLLDPHAASALERAAHWLQKRGLSGLRLNPGLSPATRLDDPGLSGVWDLVASLEVPLSLRIAPGQLPALGHMLTRFPRVPVVIDYLNPEAFADPPHFAAFEQLAQLARHPRLYAKLLPLAAHSGQGFPYADLLPAYERLYRAFGAQRLIWGSGWPDTRPALPYAQALAWGQSLSFFASSELDGFLGSTARQLWRLPVAETAAS